MININGKEIKNLVTEMSMFEYEHVSHILANKNLDDTTKHVKIFVYFGADETYLNSLNFKDEFLPLVKEYNTQSQSGLNLTKSFDLNGYTYRACADDIDFSVSVSDMKSIKKALTKEKYLCDWMAVVFKREDLTAKEHYTDAHLKQKAKLFRELSAEISVPYLVAIGNIFKEELQVENNKHELEQNNTEAVL